MSMNCCGAGMAAEACRNVDDLSRVALDEELARAGRAMPDGTAEYVLNVPSIHCGACISAIERGLGKGAGRRLLAREPDAAKRVTVRLDSASRAPGFLDPELEKLGYKAFPFESASLAEAPNDAGRRSCCARSAWPALRPATSCCFRFRSGRARTARPAICSIWYRR